MAVKAFLNLNIGVDKQGNTIYATVYPKTTADQIQGLNEAIRTEINNATFATTTTKGSVIIGNNITIDDNGKINITAENISNALNYTPAIGNDNGVASAADKLAESVNIRGVNFDGSTDVNNYVICETEADEQIKQIEINNFNSSNGAELIINFINGNKHDTPLLQINDNEQLYPIVYNSNSFVNIRENHVYHFIFNNNQCQLIGETNIISGIKGIANQDYKTGLVNLDKNDIGLDCVDNTADSVKSVLYATYALKDASGNDFDLQYCTNADKTQINNTIQKNKDLANDQYIELKDKYFSTNDIIADLRSEIIYNNQHINTNADQINNINNKVTVINTKINDNDERINDLYSELSIMNDNIASTYDVAQTGLNNTAKIASDVADINAKIELNNASITSAFAAIDNIDKNAETAIKDQQGNVIDEYYAPIDNPIFTGSVRTNTNISIDNNNNILATTKFVHDLINQTLQIETDVLSAFSQLSDLLSDNTALSDNILSLIESKQDKTDTLSNFIDTANTITSNSILINSGYNTWNAWPISSFAAEYLSQSNASMMRDKIDALGKSEKAVSAVNADTAKNCLGNALTASGLAVSRNFSITDGINTGETVEFDGTDGISIPLPKKIQADLEGTAKYAEFLHNAKNIQVNLANTNKVKFDNDKDISPGVTGILPVNHGGTGVADLNNFIVGISKRIENYIDMSQDSQKNIIYTQFDNEFMRMRIDIEEDSDTDNNTDSNINNIDNNIDSDSDNNSDNNEGSITGVNTNVHGYLEIATADKANEPIYVRQYYGNFNTCERTLTLLDSKGNTNIPGQLTMHDLIIPTERPRNPKNGSIWIE